MEALSLKLMWVRPSWPSAKLTEVHSITTVARVARALISQTACTLCRTCLQCRLDPTCFVWVCNLALHIDHVFVWVCVLAQPSCRSGCAVGQPGFTGLRWFSITVGYACVCEKLRDGPDFMFRVCSMPSSARGLVAKDVQCDGWPLFWL